MGEISADIQVRSMQPRDVACIAELEKICFSIPWSEEALDESLGKSEYIFLAAELDGKIAGYVGMISALDEGDITDVAVFPEYRKKGVACALLTALKDRCAALGISRIFLEVRESNAPAIGLYEKMGFERIGLRRNFYDAPREHAVLMSCILIVLPEDRIFE